MESDNAIKRVRAATGLSQPKFAQAYRIPVATLRYWESGGRQPDAAASALLLAIERDPVAMRRLLE